jgi:uncharacterized membrane protein
MTRMPFKTRILTLVVILTNVLGNFALSFGMKARALATSPTFVSYVSAFFSPVVLLGVSLLIVWLLSRMALMSWADLSFVLPVTSLGYVLSALMGYWFLAEHVTSRRWAGTLLIVAGTLLVSFTPHKSQTEKPS